VTIRRTILNKTGAQCVLERGGATVGRRRGDRGIAKFDGEVVSRQGMPPEEHKSVQTCQEFTEFTHFQSEFHSNNFIFLFAFLLQSSGPHLCCMANENSGNKMARIRLRHLTVVNIEIIVFCDVNKVQPGG
jgi:hypothetical protein